jgi:hypothetical protein
MDQRNLTNVACAMFEDEPHETREDHYLHFVMGAQFMFERMHWMIGEASKTDDYVVDPGLLDWVERDTRFAVEQAPQWRTEAKPVKQARQPEPMPRPRNVLSDKDATADDYSLFGEGWNPDRFATFWDQMQRDLIPDGCPQAAVDSVRATFLAGISTCFYDIAKVYVKAANAREPQAFRLYLRDFRRSLEKYIASRNGEIH